MRPNRTEIHGALTQLDSYFSRRPEDVTKELAFWECGQLRIQFAREENGRDAEIAQARRIVGEIEHAILTHDLQAGLPKCGELRAICDEIWPTRAKPA